MDQATATHVGKLWIIVLAAGGSRRLGTAKQLLRVAGRTLLARTIACAAEISNGRVIAVLGADSARMRAHVRRNAPGTWCVYNRNWRRGMGSSLASGIRALPGTAEAALVLLCDQPGVDLHSLRRLTTRQNRWNRAVIVASRYAGRLGVPAIFPRRAFKELRRLDSDHGARTLLNVDAADFRIVAVDMPEAAFDIDTPADVATLKR